MDQREFFSIGPEDFERRLQVSPNDPKLLFFYGLKLGDCGRISEAENAFRNVLRLDPNHYHAAVSLGEALVDQRRFDEAEPVLKIALDSELLQAQHRAWVFLAQVQIHHQQYLEARSTLFDLIRNPEFFCFPTVRVERALTELLAAATNVVVPRPANFQRPVVDRLLELKPDGHKTVTWKVRTFRNLESRENQTVVVASVEHLERNNCAMNHEFIYVEQVLRMLRVNPGNVLFLKHCDEMPCGHLVSDLAITAATTENPLNGETSKQLNDSDFRVTRSGSVCAVSNSEFERITGFRVDWRDLLEELRATTS